MIFQHTIDKVLSGEKTQTRRIVKLGEYYNSDRRLVQAGARPVYQIGYSYAVQAGRGKASEGRICITDITREDVRQITESDLLAEGFEHKVEFLDVWCRMHDWAFYKRYLQGVPIHAHMPSPVVLPDFYAALDQRPAEHYDAWRIAFYLTGATS